MMMMLPMNPLPPTRNPTTATTTTSSSTGNITHKRSRSDRFGLLQQRCANNRMIRCRRDHHQELLLSTCIPLILDDIDFTICSSTCTSSTCLAVQHNPSATTSMAAGEAPSSSSSNNSTTTTAACSVQEYYASSSASTTSSCTTSTCIPHLLYQRETGQQQRVVIVLVDVVVGRTQVQQHRRRARTMLQPAACTIRSTCTTGSILKWQQACTLRLEQKSQEHQQHHDHSDDPMNNNSYIKDNKCDDRNSSSHHPKITIQSGDSREQQQNQRQQQQYQQEPRNKKNNNMVTTATTTIRRRTDNNINNSKSPPLSSWRPYCFRQLTFRSLYTPSYDAILGIDPMGSYLVGIGQNPSSKEEVVDYNNIQQRRGQEDDNNNNDSSCILALRFYGIASPSRMDQQYRRCLHHHDHLHPRSSKKIASSSTTPLFLTIPLLNKKDEQSHHQQQQQHRRTNHFSSNILYDSQSIRLPMSFFPVSILFSTYTTIGVALTQYYHVLSIVVFQVPSSSSTSSVTTTKYNPHSCHDHKNNNNNIPTTTGTNHTTTTNSNTNTTSTLLYTWKLCTGPPILTSSSSIATQRTKLWHVQLVPQQQQQRKENDQSIVVIHDKTDVQQQQECILQDTSTTTTTTTTVTRYDSTVVLLVVHEPLSPILNLIWIAEFYNSKQQQHVDPWDGTTTTTSSSIHNHDNTATTCCYDGTRIHQIPFLEIIVVPRCQCSQEGTTTTTTTLSDHHDPLVLPMTILVEASIHLNVIMQYMHQQYPMVVPRQVNYLYWIVIDIQFHGYETNVFIAYEDNYGDPMGLFLCLDLFTQSCVVLRWVEYHNEDRQFMLDEMEWCALLVQHRQTYLNQQQTVIRQCSSNDDDDDPWDFLCRSRQIQNEQGTNIVKMDRYNRQYDCPSNHNPLDTEGLVLISHQHHPNDLLMRNSKDCEIMNNHALRTYSPVSTLSSTNAPIEIIYS